jgi:hypothetical protein
MDILDGSEAPRGTLTTVFSRAGAPDAVEGPSRCPILKIVPSG